MWTDTISLWKKTSSWCNFLQELKRLIQDIQDGCPRSASLRADPPPCPSDWSPTYILGERYEGNQNNNTSFFCILGLQILAPWAPAACFLVSFKKALSLQKWWFLRDRLLQWDPHWSPWCFFFCRPPWQAYRKLSMKWHPDKNQDNQEPWSKVSYHEMTWHKKIRVWNDEYEGHQTSSCTLPLRKLHIMGYFSVWT